MTAVLTITELSASQLLPMISSERSHVLSNVLSTESPQLLPVNRPQLSKEFIEHEYTNRARVPDFQHYFDQWSLDSAQTRTQLPYTTHRYGVQPLATFDLFQAPNAQALMVFIHGGYWRSLSKNNFSFIARSWVQKNISVAVIDYDLCPSVRVGTIVDQCVAALHLLARVPNIAQRWLIAGHSAGGHVAAMLWTQLPQIAPQVAQKIVAGVSISGVHDLDPMVDYSVNADLQLTREEAHRLSPIAYAPVLTAPLVVAVGALESSEFLRQSQLLFSAWPSVCQQPGAGLLYVDDTHHFSVLQALDNPEHALHQRLHTLL